MVVVWMDAVLLLGLAAQPKRDKQITIQHNVRSRIDNPERWCLTLDSDMASTQRMMKRVLVFDYFCNFTWKRQYRQIHTTILKNCSCRHCELGVCPREQGAQMIRSRQKCMAGHDSNPAVELSEILKDGLAAPSR